jgi:hypothetical protein
LNLELVGIVFPFIIWFYGSAIVVIRGWGCGFGNSEHIVTWSENRPSFTVLGFMAVVAFVGVFNSLTTGLVVKPN